MARDLQRIQRRIAKAVAASRPALATVGRVYRVDAAQRIALVRLGGSTSGKRYTVPSDAVLRSLQASLSIGRTPTVELSGTTVLRSRDGEVQPSVEIDPSVARLDEAQTWTATQTMPAIITTGDTPGIAAGAGAGTSPTISIVGTNTSGAIILTAGTAPSANATLANITFTAPPGVVPTAIILQPVAADSIGSSVHTLYTSWTATGWTLQVGATALAAGSVHRWCYYCTF